MRIEIDKFIITSDKSGYTLLEPKIQKTGKHAGKIKDEVIGYYGDIVSLFKCFPERACMGQDYKSLQALVNAYKSYQNKIEAAFKKDTLTK